MKRARLQWRAYALPLREPIVVRGNSLTRREGVLVRAELPSGAAGWGDAAPLPGFRPETLSQVIRELDALEAGMCEPAACSSSVRFAVESALADAEAAARGTSLGEFLLGQTAGSCAVNALIAEPIEKWADAAARCAAEGFSVAKVKVGREAWRREAAALRDAAAAAPALRWRLDANRAWSMDEALPFARAIAGLPVDYIEEPFREQEPLPSEWPESVGMAWDETLQGGGAIPEPCRGVKAFVIKPTLCGGLDRSLALAKTARARGVTPVFSSAYESGVGVRILAELGAACGSVAGLDIYRALDADVLIPPLRFAAGALDLAAARRSEVIL